MCSVRLSVPALCAQTKLIEYTLFALNGFLHVFLLTCLGTFSLFFFFEFFKQSQLLSTKMKRCMVFFSENSLHTHHSRVCNSHCRASPGQTTCYPHSREQGTQLPVFPVEQEDCRGGNVSGVGGVQKHVHKRQPFTAYWL